MNKSSSAQLRIMSLTQLTADFAMAAELSFELVADLAAVEHKFAVEVLDVWGCQRLNMADLFAELVHAVVPERPEVELHQVLPSNSNILHRSSLDCCCLQRHPFRVSSTCNP